MRRLFAAFFSMFFLLLFAVSASGAAPASYKPLAGADVSVKALSHVTLADGTTDANGKFEIADVAARDDEWLIVTVATGTESLSGVYSGKELVIDPVSDAFVKSILMNQNVVGNFTISEIELIKAGLYEAAASANITNADTAAESVDALISYEPFRLALADMLLSYSSFGDNIATVQDIVTALDKSIPILYKLDRKSMAEYAAPDAEIAFEGKSFKADGLFQWIAEFNKRFEVKEWNVNYSRFMLQEDAATVETIESVFFVSKDSKEDVRDSLFFVNEIEKTDGKWLLRKRYEKECVPARATIFADKSSWDWAGASPCMLSFHGKDTDSGYHAGIYSVYFAMDALQFYWRMEVDTTQIQEAMNSGSADISFMISLLNRVDDEAKEDVYSVVGVKNGIPYSVNQVRRIAPDGFPEKLAYLPNNFIVTPGYVEGTISLEELKALGREFYANARILLDTDNAKSQILAEGIPIKIKLEPTD